MKTRKTSIIALVALLVVALVGTTIAYWSQTSTIENPFSTGDQYGSTIVEKFTPKDGEDWLPGVKVPKSVTVSNDGNTDILVRAKLTETWTRKSGGDAYISLDKKDPYTIGQAGGTAGLTDGLTTGDRSVVRKNFAPGGKWTDSQADGWCYYKTNLTKGNKTAPWLDSVELVKDIDMGAPINTFSVAVDESHTKWYKLPAGTTETPKYVTINDADGTAKSVDKDATGAKPVLYGKQEIKIDPTAPGYSNSNYVLTVTVQTVQATKDAVNAVFGSGMATAQPDGCNWNLR